MKADYLIDEHGAVADGQTLNTAAIQEAIATCHRAGGGRVVCGPGTWLTGSLDLLSDVEFHLAPGCRLLASPDLADYSPLEAKGFHPERAPEKSAHSLLRAVDADNVTLTGSGSLDGNGLAFYEDTQGQGKLDKPDTPRPRLGMFYRCRGLRLEGCTFVDSACWTLWLMRCEGARIHHIAVRGNRRLRNVDGIDLDACRNVTVSDCDFDTEDDCIAVRAIQSLYDSPAVCESIAVTNCLLRTSCQGVRVGCPSDGTIRNCTFSNLVIESTGNGILFQYPRHYLRPGTQGTADVHDVIFSDVVLTCQRTPIGIVVEDGIALTRLSGLSFANFRIQSGLPCLIQGSPGTTVRDVHFSNVRLATAGDDAILSRHCEGLRLDNVEVSSGAAG